ncbi:MAG: PEP-CTERM sorting domain-containing protein [Planctomycetota bacterium]|jgi:hypothetical protein
MIKKAEILTVIILVLGTSSMAHAGLSFAVGDGTNFADPGNEFTISIGDTIWIGINDSLGEMYTALIDKELNLEEGEWTGNSAVYSPPAISTAPGWTYASDGFTERWRVDLRDPDSTETPLPGVGCAVEFRGLSESYLWLALNPSPSGSEDVLFLNIVPEPTTGLLLALGSLIVTRRRR